MKLVPDKFSFSWVGSNHSQWQNTSILTGFLFYCSNLNFANKIELNLVANVNRMYYESWILVYGQHCYVKLVKLS